MKRNDHIIVVACALATAVAQTATASEALARKNECFACHAVAKPVVGPAYRDVAAKYAAQPGAEDQLAHSIREGGSGRWGEIAMPPQPKLSDADAHDSPSGSSPARSDAARPSPVGIRIAPAAAS